MAVLLVSMLDFLGLLRFLHSNDTLKKHVLLGVFEDFPKQKQLLWLHMSYQTNMFGA